MEIKAYNTKQRSSIMKIFEENPEKCFSAKELIKNPEISLGEATVYRTLSKFVEEGKIKKYISQDQDGATYQYNSASPQCNNHFHLKCVECGVLIHMDCHLMDSIKKHIKEEHCFLVDNTKTTLYGLCDKCNGK